MLPEISLNILDITENSTKAGATEIEISVSADFEKDNLTVKIIDNGCGMDEKQVQNVTNPFFTTRTTRKVGLGVPFFKMAAESTGGKFDIKSKVSVGTSVIAEFKLSSIDRMPMGELDSTIWQLMTMHEDVNFIFNYTVNKNSFSVKSNDFKEVLGEIPFTLPEVSTYIKEYLSENIKEVTGNNLI